MPRVTHFEISADDMDRAKAFYESVFDWTFNKFDGPQEYYFVATGEGPGIDGGMFRRQGPMVGHINSVSVDDIDACCERIKAAGGEIVVEKMPIGDTLFIAYAKDLEGSLFGLHQAVG